MVLSSRRSPRAALLAALAAAAALAGCNQSLFDNHNGVGGDGSGSGSGSDAGTDGPVVPTACPAGCLGDAAANFNDRTTAMAALWRYLEDQGRAWQAMTDSGSTMTGKGDPANQITSCKAKPGAPACVALPGALLMSSSANSPVDPAIEFALPAGMPPQVIQLSLRAYLASGVGQTIRIYRNSREDLLFSSPLIAKNLVEQPTVVDALPGDRFLVAISGTDAASDVALQLYVHTPADTTFPASCQLALSFNPPMGNSTPDPCSKYTFSATPAPVMLGAAPFMEQGKGAVLTQGGYLQRDGIAPDNALNWKDHDVTVQFWTQPMTLGSTEAYLFSDFDPDTCGGVELSVGALGGPAHFNLSGCIDPDPMKSAQGQIMPSPAFPMDGGWHFIRVVRNAAGFDLCIDGNYVASLPVQPGIIESHNQPELGKQYSASSAFFAGGFDDVRVLTGALPCK